MMFFPLFKSLNISYEKKLIRFNFLESLNWRGRIFPSSIFLCLYLSFSPEELQPLPCAWEPGGLRKGTDLEQVAKVREEKIQGCVCVYVSFQSQVEIILNFYSTLNYNDFTINFTLYFRTAQRTQMTRNSELVRIPLLVYICPRMRWNPRNSTKMLQR